MEYRGFGWVGLIGLVALTPRLAAAEGPPGRAVQLIAAHSDKCVGVAGSSKDPEARVVQRACDRGEAGQAWRLEPVGQLFRLVAVHSGLCLDVRGESRDDGAQLIQWTCKGAGQNKNQLWRLEGSPERSALVAAHSGRCADVAGRSRDDDAPLVQYGCNQGSNQRFQLKPIPVAEPPAVAAPDPIVGEWGWFNEVVVQIRADGSLLGSNQETGHWRLEDPGQRRYQLRWKAGWVDRLILSPDGNSLNGSNNQGTQVSGRRQRLERPQLRPRPPPMVPDRVQAPRDCGTGADDPGCSLSRDGRLPADAGTFTSLLAAARAQRSQIGRRDQVLAGLGPQLLTARQYAIVLDLFRSEIDRMSVARGLAKGLVDPEHAMAFAEKFRSSTLQRDYVRMLSAYLQPAREPPPPPSPLEGPADRPHLPDRRRPNR